MKSLVWEALRARLRGQTSYIAQVRCRGRRTLDVGCGFGAFLRYDPANFVGIDINEEALAHCRSRNYQVQRGSVAELPFPDSSLDAVVAMQVIEHLPHELAYKMFLEAARVLREGGEFILSTEMPTARVWDTFSHVKPYSPRSIEKILTAREDHYGQENYAKLGCLEIIGIYYHGRFFHNPVFNAVSHLLSNLTCFNRHNYTLVLRKRTSMPA